MAAGGAASSDERPLSGSVDAAGRNSSGQSVVIKTEDPGKERGEHAEKAETGDASVPGTNHVTEMEEDPQFEAQKEASRGDRLKDQPSGSQKVSAQKELVKDQPANAKEKSAHREPSKDHFAESQKEHQKETAREERSELELPAQIEASKSPDPQNADCTAMQERAEKPRDSGHGRGAPVNADESTDGPEESPVVQLVQRKWQMCSCVHFFSVFADCLPLGMIAPATAAALSPLLLERAVGDPEADITYSLVYRDVVCCLLVALKEIPMRAATERWFSALNKFVLTRPQDFPDCFEAPTGNQAHELKEAATERSAEATIAGLVTAAERGSSPESMLERFSDGMSFVLQTTWQCRLGLLQSLCDIASEEAECIRELLKEAERLSSVARQEVEARHYRLVPMGRCSRKRFYFCVGGSRIYSALKRKGTGVVCVECSDAKSMSRMVDRLESSESMRDKGLGAKIRSWYLLPLRDAEDRKRRKIDRELAVEAQREEARRRNAERPRRTRAAYS